MNQGPKLLLLLPFCSCARHGLERKFGPARSCLRPVLKLDSQAVSKMTALHSNAGDNAIFHTGARPRRVEHRNKIANSKSQVLDTKPLLAVDEPFGCEEPASTCQLPTV